MHQRLRRSFFKDTVFMNLLIKNTVSMKSLIKDDMVPIQWAILLIKDTKSTSTKRRLSQLPMAYFLVQSLAFLSASASFAFHNSATSFANGSSGLGAERRAWMERRTVLI